MPQLDKWRLSRTIVALVTLAVLGFVGATAFWFSEHRSPEKHAQNYYEHGVKLAEHGDPAKAVIELRNALRLNRNLLPAWRSLAQIEETHATLGRPDPKFANRS